MKKLSLILCGGLALSAGLFSCNKENTKETAATTTTSAGSIDGKKIVFVNTDSLLTKTLRKNLKTKATVYKLI